MGINDFIEKFAEIFDDTDASSITPDTKFRDMEEWSSISALGVIAMANEEFDVELTGSDIRSAETVQQLFKIISEK